jgi:signal transduction histidine kinase
MTLWDHTRRAAFWLLAISLAVFGAWNLVGSIQAINQPFAGFTVQHDQTLAWRQVPDWTGARAGLAPVDRIVSIDGKPVTDARQVAAEAAARPVGTPIGYEVERVDLFGHAKRFTATVPTQRFGVHDWLAGYFTFWLSGLAFWAIGVAVSLLKPGDVASRLHLGLCFGFAMVGFGHFDGTHGYVLMPNAGYVIALGVMGACFVNLALIFPRVAWPAHSRRLMIANTALAVGVVGAALALHATGKFYLATHLLTLGYAFPATLALAVSAAWARFSRTSTELERTQSAIILWTTGLAFTPSNWTYVAAYLGHPIPAAEVLELGLIMMPLGIAYAIARHRLFDVDRLVARSLAYTLLASLLLGLYAAVAVGGRALSGGHGELSALLATVAVAVAFAPLRDRTQAWLDAAFFRAGYDFASVVAAFTDASQDATTPEKLWEAFWAQVRDALAPSHGAWRGPEPDAGWRLAFAEDGVEAVSPETGLVLPLAHHGVDLGSVAFGPKRSGMPYAGRDTELLVQLSRQLAVALHLLVRIEEETRQRRAAEAMAEAQAMQDAFLGLVSHELRAPIAVIKSSMDVLERLTPEADPMTLKHQRRVQQAATGLSGLVNDLLNAAQLRAGRFLLRPEAIAFEALLRDAAEEVGAIAAEKGIRLELAIEASLPAGRGDRHRLAQVLRNLLHNALRHTPEDGVVVIGARVEAEGVCLTVADTGTGIAPELRDRLFERFASTGGVGLGLFIAKGLVEAHGGRITVESEPGAGSRFLVWLPQAPVEAVAAAG